MHRVQARVVVDGELRIALSLCPHLRSPPSLLDEDGGDTFDGVVLVIPYILSASFDVMLKKAVSQ